MRSNRLLRRALALAAPAAGLLAWQTVALAAEAPTAAGAELMEIVVTGSSIAQKPDSTSLPVLTVSAEDIAKTGYNSIVDLVQNLPAMQNFVAGSASVNGGGGGVTTASLHALPSKYTLVLIDGQRIAPFGLNNAFGGGFGVNLESIPLQAIERVEVLTDGASALYGADAVAGVVNFITKKNTTEGELYYHNNMPDQGQGGGWTAGLSKGFGDLKADGYNILFSYNHDIQDKLQASERAVSVRGAYFPFTSGGVNYIYNNRTSNTAPANITIGSIGLVYNPFFIANGNCGQGALAAPLTTAQGTNCRFNYAATVQDIPGSVRDSGLLKGTMKVGDNAEVWAEAMVTDYTMRAQYAPPAQPLPISPTQLPLLWNTYVVGNPLLEGHTVCTALPCPAGSITSGQLGYRAVSAGGRTDDYRTLSRQIAVGFNAKAWDWDFKGAIIQSHGKLTDTAAGGYLDFAQFNAAIAAGAYDPVMETGSSSIQGAILHSQFSATYSDITALTFNAQHKIFDMDGGASILSVGAEYDLTKYKTDYSNLILSQSGFSTQPSSLDYPVGGNYGQVPFFASRDNWGLFGEWLFPILKNLNVTASARYDSYAKVYSSTVFSPNVDLATGLYDQVAPAKLGNTFDDVTFKLSARWTPLQWLSFRGSVGTGFRAPGLGDIAGALTFAGSTANSYACPFPGSVGCIPGSAQYDLVAGPNGTSGPTGLKPEKSTQYTFGVRFEPVSGLSLAFDYWYVKIKDQIESQGIAENVAYNNPQAYASLFINPYTDPAGFQTIALEQVPFNGGEAKYSGIDWNFNYRLHSGIGLFGVDWTGTYMLKQTYTNGPGLPELTDLGQYGPDQQVVFRVTSQLRLSLQSGRWLNTLVAHYKSGYNDQAHTAGESIVFLANPDGSIGTRTDFGGLKISDFATLDFQTAYTLRENLDIAAGVTNLTGKMPPLSLQSGGGGNQAGYDGRYYDPTGRAYYVRVGYKF